MELNEIQFKVKENSIFRRFEKIDWKQIASIDLDQLKHGTDCDLIERNIRNILCCHIESEFSEKNADNALVMKLFTLAQISIEYLLHVRQQIIGELRADREKLNSNEKLLNAALKEKEELTRKLKELKKESKKSNIAQYFRCPLCPKTFVNGDFLRCHLTRRHALIFESQQQYQHQQSTKVSFLADANLPTESPAIATPSLVPVIANPPEFEVLAAAPSPTTAPLPSPVKLITESSKDEINEFKTRLQLTEKKLEEDKALLNVILDKVENSSVSLQGILLKEVEKIRSSLVENQQLEFQKAVEHTTKIQPLPRRDILVQSSPVTTSSAVQTTPRQLEQKTESTETSQENSEGSTSPDRRDPKDGIGKIEEKVASFVPDSRPAASFKVVQVRKEEPDPSSTDHGSSSSDDYDTRDESETNLETSSEKGLRNRQVDGDLFRRFRKTIENAFEQRLKQIGIDTKQGLNSKKYRKALHQLEEQRLLHANRQTKYNQIRRQLEEQLKKRLNSTKHEVSRNVQDQQVKKKHAKRSEITEKPRVKTSRPKTAKASENETIISKASESVPQKTESITRAPVPIPRTRTQTLANASFMSRDGEAADSSFQATKSVRDLAESLEQQIKSRTAHPPANSLDTLPNGGHIIVDEQKLEEENDDDSFSLSSLDEILARLHQPNGSTSTPKAQRSVQWKEPIESSRVELDNSWDSA